MNNITSGNIDRLIREDKISAAMATSLMNDYGYAQNIVSNLVDMAEVLFGSRDIATRDAEDLIALDDEEIRDLAEQQAASPDMSDQPAELRQ